MVMQHNLNNFFLPILLALLLVLTGCGGRGISGTVRDLNGEPISGAHVMYYEQWYDGFYDPYRLMGETVTDENGRYTVESNLIGGYDFEGLAAVSASKPGHYINAINNNSGHDDGWAYFKLNNNSSYVVDLLAWDRLGDPLSEISEVMPSSGQLVSGIIEEPLSFNAQGSVSTDIPYYFRWDAYIAETGLSINLSKSPTQWFDLEARAWLEGATLRVTLMTKHWTEVDGEPRHVFAPADYREWRIDFQQTPPIWVGSVVTTPDSTALHITSDYTEITGYLRIIDAPWEGVDRLSNINTIGGSLIVVETETLTSLDRFALDNLDSLFRIDVSNNKSLETLHLDQVTTISAHSNESAISHNNRLRHVSLDGLTEGHRLRFSDNPILETLSLTSMNAILGFGTLFIIDNPLLKTVDFGELIRTYYFELSGSPVFENLKADKLEQADTLKLISDSETATLQLSSLCSTGGIDGISVSRINMPNVCSSELNHIVDQVEACSGLGRFLYVTGDEGC